MTVALAQHLYRAARGRVAQDEDASQHLRREVEMLDAHSTQLGEDNHAKAEALEALAAQIDLLDKSSGGYKGELERVKVALTALEDQSETATEHLSAAYSQLNETQWEVMELERTIDFMKEVFQVLAEEHEQATFPQHMMTWFCDRFGIVWVVGHRIAHRVRRTESTRRTVALRWESP